MIDEVDSFLFRPHLGLRSKYRAVCLPSSCLTELILNSFSIIHLGGFAYMKAPKLVWISVVDFELIK